MTPSVVSTDFLEQLTELRKPVSSLGCCCCCCKVVSVMSDSVQPHRRQPTRQSPLGSAIPGILQARTLEWVAISFSSAWKWKVKMKLLSHVWLFATPWTAAHQAPPSMRSPWFLIKRCNSWRLRWKRCIEQCIWEMVWSFHALWECHSSKSPLVHQSRSSKNLVFGDLWRLHHKPWESVMDREAWRAEIHGVAKSRTGLSNWSDLIWSSQRHN